MRRKRISFRECTRNCAAFLCIEGGTIRAMATGIERMFLWGMNVMFVGDNCLREVLCVGSNGHLC
jgi:hypothetical protein